MVSENLLCLVLQKISRPDMKQLVFLILNEHKQKTLL